MAELTLGLVATSGKEDERRLPVHPRHFERIDESLRRRIVIEEGYAQRFGFEDAELAPLVAGVRPRDELFRECDIVCLPKPMHPDVEALRPGQVLFGWPHCVQDPVLTQLAIDSRLTVIAWEAMHHWTRTGALSLHVFHLNNELAGYCSVLHAMQLRGASGYYGLRVRAAVLSFGATARGAVAALFALGVHDVTVLTNRSVAGVAAPMPPARLVQYDRNLAHPARRPEMSHPNEGSLGEYLARFDIVVNCILQDTSDPLIFVTDEEVQRFQRGALIVDVSCDEGMGFEWARPTSFAEPTFEVGPGVHYYAVDHSPSYLWNSATWEVSEALIPHLAAVMAGPDGWEESDTIRHAVEISDGVVRNEAILAFQDREQEYPHARR